MKNITEKKEYISQYLGFPEHLIVDVSVSAYEGYNVTHLVEEMVRAIPKHAQSAVAAQVKEEHKTEKVIEEATDGFGDTVERVIDESLIWLLFLNPSQRWRKWQKSGCGCVQKNMEFDFWIMLFRFLRSGGFNYFIRY